MNAKNRVRLDEPDNKAPNGAKYNHIPALHKE